jgi:glycosyltransferase involved in cell wall biosynthesis
MAVTIALDATATLAQHPRGVDLYCTKIIAALAGLAPQERFLLCYRANRFFRALHSPLPAPNCSRRLLEDPFCYFWKYRVSLFHGLAQRLPVRCRFRRMVTTVHDLFPLLKSHYFEADFARRLAARLRDAAERSDHIIAVSRYTEEQLVDHLKVPRSQITVIYLATDPIPEFSTAELQAFRQEHALEAPFFLYVGALETRKNTARVVEAFEGLPSDFLLVLAGAGGVGFEPIWERIQASPARNRIRSLGHLGREPLARLYRTAIALVFPSLDESFGLPVVEAMSAGLPVVTSNGSALPEIAGDAALLVDPEQTEEIRLALERVLSDSTCRERLIQAGRRRAAAFTWENAAAATLETYRRL